LNNYQNLAFSLFCGKFVGDTTAYFVRLSQVLHDRNIWACFLFGYGMGILTKHDFQVLQGSVKTLFR